MLITDKFSGYSADGRREYHFGGGGGGSGGGSGTQTQVVDLPEWAKPTAQKQLGLAESLTDINKNPYQSFSSWAQQKGMDPTQVANFSGLQQQAFQGAGQLQPSAATDMGMGLAGAAGMRALGTRFNPYQTGQFGQQAGDYMSPFIQQALEPQMREARRQSEIQRNMDQAQAVGRGAFGGSRQAIVEAERQRNLGMQLGDIQARGMQSAFDQARQQFNTEQQLREQSRQYGAGLGLQGLQTALQGAGQLGQLGTQQFGQAKDVIGLQSQMGAQQQAQEQALINARMQDYQAQQRYPYQQLEFMSNILRGTPMGTVQTLYGAQPSTASQLMGAGTSLAGAYMMGGGKFAEGGLASAYAEGGSVTDDRKVESIISKLSDAQLQQARQMAMARKDADQLQLIDRELAERAAMRAAQPAAGIDALPADNMDFADGGIVAFADGGEVERYGDLGFTGYSFGNWAEADRERRRKKLEEERAANMAAVAQGSTYSPEAYGVETPAPLFQDPRLLGAVPPIPAPTASAPTAPASSATAPSANRTAPKADATRRVPGAPKAPAAAPAAAAATDAGLAALDPAKMLEDALKKQRGEVRPEKDLLETLNKERTAAAEKELEGERALEKRFADAYKGRRERLAAREGELGKMKDQNLGLALLQAGAAMMSTPGSLGTSIGKGIESGSKQYVAGMDKLNAAKDKLADARDRLDELQLNRDEMSAREIFKAENKIRDTALAGRESMIKFVMERDKVDRDTAMKIVEQQMNLGLTQLREAGATQRAKMGADATVTAAGIRGAGNENKDVAAAEAAFARDPSAKALAKRLEMLAGNPQSAKYQEALRELETIRASKYREFGITLPGAPGAPSPGGTMSGWGKASVVNP